MAIITVISPGFLTVQPLPSTDITELQVPQPYFNMTNFGTRQSSGGQSLVSGDSRIYKLAYHAGASSQPVPLESTFANETYHLDFEGPAVKCMSANDSVVYNITIDHGTVLQASSGNPVELLSWVAGDVPSEVVREKGAHTLDMTSADAARLFVMTNTGNWSETLGADSNGMPYQYRKVNVTECLLYNATYSVHFAFKFPGQSRDLRIVNWLNPVATITDLTRPNPDTEPAVVSYTAIMDAFGKMLVGTSTKSHYGADKAYLTSSKILNIDWSSGDAVARGLEQLFQNITLSLLSDEGLMYAIPTSLKDIRQLLTNPLQTQFHHRRLRSSHCHILADNIRVPQDRSVHHVRLRAVQRAGLLYHRPLRLFCQPQVQLPKYILDVPPRYGQDGCSIQNKEERYRRRSASQTTW